MKRREFLLKSTAISVGLSTQLFNPGVSFGKILNTKEEALKKKKAKYIFNFASPYFTDKFVTTPHAHREIKQLIESYTKGKVYVNIYDGGSEGIGSSLSNSVKLGAVQGALLSVSNLVPLVKELDILNIPFWSSNEKDYLRLFKSGMWGKHVLSKMNNYNIQVLFPYVVGARTASTVKKYGKTIKKPEDFVGVDFRIPGSECLKIFYKLTKASPVNIPWRLCARTARAGRYQALDPAIIGLYAGPDGLNKEIGVISEIESVHDGWVAIGNKKYIEELDPKTRSQFLEAFEEIQLQQYQNYQTSRNFCVKEFKKLGTEIYYLTTKEKENLANAFGHQNKAYDDIKKKLLGENGLSLFDGLYKAAKG